MQVDNGVRAAVESTTPLAANAKYVGETYDTAVAAGTSGTPGIEQLGVSRFRVFAAADVAGTLAVEQSRDGQVWFQTTSFAIAADFTKGSVLESMVVLRYVRMTVLNGGSNQTKAEFDSALVAV